MSRLAHAVFAAPHFEAEKASQSQTLQLEIRNAKAIQAQTGCGWTEALRKAYQGHPHVAIPLTGQTTG